MYYNTTNLRTQKLKEAIASARNLETMVYGIFFVLDKELTPANVLWYLEKSRKLYPITSVRRAITNLTNEGKLYKTNRKEIGLYGKENYKWALNKLYK